MVLITKMNRFKGDLQSDESKPSHIWRGRGGLLLCKVNDNASTETISVERLIATIIASKIVKGINSFLFHKLNEIG